MVYSRDRFTWLAYLMLGYFAYSLTIIGPSMPFLRAELKLSYAQGGLHLSAFAVGMIAVGLAGDRVARRWGRLFTFWGGAAGQAAGAVVLALGHHLALTVGGSLIMGALGSLLLMTIQAALSDRHGERRAIALTESNIVASACSMLAPLCVGGLALAGIGWRGAFWLVIGLAAALAVAFRGTPVPAVGGSALPQSLPPTPYGRRDNTAAPRPPLRNEDTRGSPPCGHLRSQGRQRESQGLPGVYWAYWTVILLCVATEWCLAFWGADFLENVAGLARSAASTTMSLFYVAMIIGRFVGSRLARRVPTATLLLAALGLTAVAFPVYWLAPAAALHVAGLFLTGLGVANLFPLALSAATSTAPGQADAASARISLAGGLAILCAPLLLGGAADRIGIQAAYGLVVALLAAAAAMAVWAGRLTARPAVEARLIDG